MWGDRAPDILAALLQLFTTSPNLGAATPAVQIFDGPTVTDETAPEILMVGWSGGDGEPDAESTMSPDGMTTTDRELCSVRCGISVIDGGTDMAPPRARAYELLRFAGAALAADRSLGGIALRAMITSVTYTPRQTAQGAQVDLVFTIACDAFTNR
jgi:hypothetical protein